MVRERAVSVSVLGELFQLGLFKPNQGRIARQVTCGAIWAAVALAALRLHFSLAASTIENAKWIFPAVLLLVGFWLGFRVVNIPRFADFLIAVEAEMNKVSWPSRAELVRSSLVVIFTIFALAFMLYAFDLLWASVFQFIGVLRGNSG